MDYYQMLIDDAGRYMYDSSTGCVDMITTKDAAKLWGLTTAKAFSIMKGLEQDGLVYNMGIKGRDGGYDYSDSRINRSSSITWSVYTREAAEAFKNTPTNH